MTANTLVATIPVRMTPLIFAILFKHNKKICINMHGVYPLVERDIF